VEAAKTTTDVTNAESSAAPSSRKGTAFDERDLASATFLGKPSQDLSSIIPEGAAAAPTCCA